MSYQPPSARLPNAAPVRTSSFKLPPASPATATPSSPATASSTVTAASPKMYGDKFRAPAPLAITSLADFPALPSRSAPKPQNVVVKEAKPSFLQIAKEALENEARAAEERARPKEIDDGMEVLSIHGTTNLRHHELEQPGTPEFGRFEDYQPEESAPPYDEYYDGGETWND